MIPPTDPGDSRPSTSSPEEENDGAWAGDHRRHWHRLGMAVFALGVMGAIGFALVPEMPRKEAGQQAALGSEAKQELPAQPEEVEADHAEAQRLLAQGRWQEAVARMVLALRRTPGNPETSRLLVELLDPETHIDSQAEAMRRTGVEWPKGWRNQPLLFTWQSLIDAPAGRRRLEFDDGRMARLIDSTTDHLVAVLGQDEPMVGGGFSEDGQQVITISSKGTVRFWLAADGTALGLPIEAPGTSVARLSPDGCILLTIGGGESVLWDVQTQKEIGKRETPGLVDVYFSPDSQCAAFQDFAGMVRIWPTQGSEMLPAPITPPQDFDNGRAVAFTPDGTRLVTLDGRVFFSADGTRLDAPSGLLAEYPDRFSKETELARSRRILARSPDGARVLAALPDDTAHILNLRTGASSPPLWHYGQINAAVFSPDGSRVITLSRDNTARLWESSTGTPLCAPLRHQSAVTDAVFRQEGREVITVSEDGAARRWDPRTGEAIAAPISIGSPLERVIMSRDGNSLAVWGDNVSIMHLVDLLKDPPMIRSLWHEWQPDRFAFSPDGRALLTQDEAMLIRLWDTETGKCTYTSVSGQQARDYLEPWVVSPDGKYAAAVKSFILRLLNTATGQPVGPGLLHPASTTALCFSPDGNLLVTDCDDKNVRIWDLASGTVRAVLPQPRATRHAVFSQDGMRLALASTTSYWDHAEGERSRIQVCDAATGSVLGETEVPARARDLWFLSGGAQLGFSDYQGNVRLIDGASAAEIRLLDPHYGGLKQVWSHPASPLVLFQTDSGIIRWDHAAGLPDDVVVAEAPGGLMSSPDGSRILTDLGFLLETRTGVILSSPLPHPRLVTQRQFSADGSVAVFLENDRIVRALDCRTGEAFPEHKEADAPHVIRVSPDNHYAAARAVDGTVSLWDVKTGKTTGEPIHTENTRARIAFLGDSSALLLGLGERVTVIDSRTGRRVGVRTGYPELESVADERQLFLELEKRDLLLEKSRAAEPIPPNLNVRPGWGDGDTDTLPAGALEKIATLCAGLTMDSAGRLFPVSQLRHDRIFKEVQPTVDERPFWRAAIEAAVPPPKRSALGASLRDAALRITVSAYLRRHRPELDIWTEANSPKPPNCNHLLELDPDNPILPFALAAQNRDQERYALWLCEYGQSRLPRSIAPDDLLLAAEYASMVPHNAMLTASLRARAELMIRAKSQGG